MATNLKNISIELPVTDISFIEKLISKMGWTLKSQEDVVLSDKKRAIEMAKDEKVQYSDRIIHLRSLRGSGITSEDIKNDDRLNYLLNR